MRHVLVGISAALLGAPSVAADPASVFRDRVREVETQPVADRLSALSDAALRAVADTGWWAVAVGSEGGESVRFGGLTRAQVEDVLNRAKDAQRVVRVCIDELRRAIEAAQRADADAGVVARAVVVADEVLPLVDADAASVIAMLSGAEALDDDTGAEWTAKLERIGGGVTALGGVRADALRAVSGAWRAEPQDVLGSADDAVAGVQRLTEDERLAMASPVRGVARSIELARAAVVARGRSVLEASAYFRERGLGALPGLFESRAWAERRRAALRDGLGPDRLFADERGLLQSLDDAAGEALERAGVRGASAIGTGSRAQWLIERAGLPVDVGGGLGGSPAGAYPSLRVAVAAALLSDGETEDAGAALGEASSAHAAELRGWIAAAALPDASDGAATTRLLRTVYDTVASLDAEDAAALASLATRNAAWGSMHTADAFEVAAALARVTTGETARVWTARAVRIAITAGQTDAQVPMAKAADALSEAGAFEGGARSAIARSLGSVFASDALERPDAVDAEDAARILSAVERASGGADGDADGVVALATLAAALVDPDSTDNALRAGVQRVRATRGADPVGVGLATWAGVRVGDGATVRVMLGSSDSTLRSGALRGAAAGVRDFVARALADGSAPASGLAAALPSVAGTTLIDDRTILSAATVLLGGDHASAEMIDRGHAGAALRAVGARLAMDAVDPATAARLSLLAARAWHAQGELEKSFASYRRTAGLADRDDALGGRDGEIAVRAWLGMLEVALDADTGGVRTAGVRRAFDRLALRPGFGAYEHTPTVTRLRDRLR